MLTEGHRARHHHNEELRRWFSDRRLDLIVWYKPDKSIHGFQLCYKSDNQEKALTWLRNKGFSHERVDDGEGNILTYKMTPILVPDGTFDKEYLLALFKKESGEIDQELRDLVCRKILEYPESKKK